ncbi:hypothetical protein DXG01_016558 [Tephrocybe rancida]|nr:hypothetical protein DXG01_016558 [Tephrocybe rancida]
MDEGDAAHLPSTDFYPPFSIVAACADSLEADLSVTSQELTSAILRGVALETQLSELGEPPMELEPDEPMEALRTQLARARTELVIARQKRQEAQNLLFDVKQETENPVVVQGIFELLQSLEALIHTRD